MNMSIGIVMSSWGMSIWAFSADKTLQEPWQPEGWCCKVPHEDGAAKYHTDLFSSDCSDLLHLR